MEAVQQRLMALQATVLSKVSMLSRNQILGIVGGAIALAIALVVWGYGDDGFLWSLFVGVAVVLFAVTCLFGSLALVLAIRHEDAQAAQWSLKSLWFLLAGVGVVLLGAVVA
jgi:hypothetical protein